jgi:hypothetical protein
LEPETPGAMSVTRSRTTDFNNTLKKMLPDFSLLAVMLHEE